MGTAMPQPTLQRLRESLAGIDPSLGPGLPEACRRVEIASPINGVLGGGLACGALHELAPGTALHLTAASGFAAALAARAGEDGGETLWVGTDFALSETGGPFGSGLDLFGLPSSRVLLLRVPRPADVLWAMEEALRCRAIACVIAELTGEGAEADLTATRRVSLAARDASNLGLLIRHRATANPSAAATRWEIASASSLPDALGGLSGGLNAGLSGGLNAGLGRTRFDLSLRKNRRGPSGRWFVEWDHHERAFQPALSVGVAAPAFDRSDRTPFRRAG
jgi:protein ImuA